MSTYKPSTITSLMLNESNSKSTLTPTGSVSESYRSMCEALGEAIAQVHNTWQQIAIVSNIIVNGGTCPPQGPLSGGIGFGASGSINGRLSGTASACLSRFPTNAMTSKTPALTSHISSIAEAFEETFNLFLDTAVIINVEVSGGTCTCQIVPPGVPVPGSYFGGIGQLSTLEGNVTGSPVTKLIMKSLAISKMDSNILAQGTPTAALSDSLDAIFQVLENTHNTWMSSTKLQNLQVNGGVTFPNSPIVAATGAGGQFV